MMALPRYKPQGLRRCGWRNSTWPEQQGTYRPFDPVTECLCVNIFIVCLCETERVMCLFPSTCMHACAFVFVHMYDVCVCECLHAMYMHVYVCVCACGLTVYKDAWSCGLHVRMAHEFVCKYFHAHECALTQRSTTTTQFSFDFV